MNELGSDLRLALRGFLRNKSLALAAIACLALGIGATTAIFSVVHAVVLRPLPYKNPAQLTRLYTEFPTFPNGGLPKFWTSGPEFLELRRDLKQWETIDAWQTRGVNVAGSNEPVRANNTLVSGTLLKTLGVQPKLGRLLRPEDDSHGAPMTAVISEGFWKRAFGGDPNILRRPVWLNGVRTNVVGVMPQGFDFPPGEVEPADVWSPIQLNPASPGGRGGHRFYLLGRLKPGVTLTQARQEMKQYVEAMALPPGVKGDHRFHPKFHPLVAFPLQEEVTGSVRPALLAMLAAVGFVLLIACGNVANLLLARAESRQREIAVRRAMGASSVGLIRQFLLEGLLLSGAGAVSGIALAYAALRVILAAAAGSIPRSAEVGIDLPVLAFTVGVAMLTGLVFGLAPLFQSLPRAAADALKSGTRTTATRGAHWLRRALVAGEMGLALMLLIGAGLMLTAFWKLQQVRTGVKSEGVLTAGISLPREIYKEPADVNAFFERLQQRLASMPGVTGASLVSGLPPIRPINANDTQIEGWKETPGGPIQNVDYYQPVGHRYFETMAIPLIEGRTFSQSDGAGAPQAVIVNEAFQRTFYPGQSALGRRVRPSFDGPWWTIVGVVADVKNGGLDKPAGTELYLPLAQVQGLARQMTVLVRTERDPLQLVNSLRAAVRELDPSLPLSEVQTMDEVVAAAQARPRFLSLLLGAFSFVALALAALGMYSVMSYAVAQRTNEFGVRMALGAQQGDVLQLVLKHGLALALAGMVAGGTGAIWLNRILKGTLLGVGQFDPLPFAGMAILLVVVALAACLAPALRATRVDPMVALRYE
jgi:putative ABC transport system permease protein